MGIMTIIVSRYNEDLYWLEESPFNQFEYIVYNKGDNDNFCKTNVKSVINLPNIGKCDHTYLYHIVQNYHQLDTILVFLPGSLDISYKKAKAVEILERIKANKQQNAIFIGDYSTNVLKEFYNFRLDNWCSSSSNNFEKNNSCNVYPANIRPFGAWYLHNFGNILVNYYTFWGIFSVHKNDIIQYPRYRYEKLVQQLEVNFHPEVGHFIERSWGAIFYPMKNTKVLIHNIPRFYRRVYRVRRNLKTINPRLKRRMFKPK